MPPEEVAMRTTPQLILQRLVENLAVCSGRNPTGFQATSTGAVVEISNAWAVASYAAEAWTSKFNRDLIEGVFDEPDAGEYPADRSAFLSSGTG